MSSSRPTERRCPYCHERLVRLGRAHTPCEEPACTAAADEPA